MVLGELTGLPSKCRLLVIDDDEAFVDVLTAGLTEEGYDVQSAASVSEGKGALAGNIDLILLDLALAAEDGLEILRWLRGEENPVPVIIMTGHRLEPQDAVTGLEAGADDYVRKPFAVAELVARIHSVLRRRRAEADAFCRAGDLAIDRVRRMVTCAGQPVSLTLRELELLALLLRQAGLAVSRSEILAQVWRDTPRSATLDNTLDVHVSRLRKKLEQADSRCRVETVWGRGFKLTVDAD